MMRKYKLRGLAEGIAGKSSIMADSIEDVFEKCPDLKAVRSKLAISANTISGFAACDG